MDLERFIAPQNWKNPPKDDSEKDAKHDAMAKPQT